MDTRKRRIEDDTPDAVTVTTITTPPLSLPSTTPSAPPPPTTPNPPPPSSSSSTPPPPSSALSPDSLRMYYDRFFPCALFTSWLSPCEPERCKLREFSFTLKDDIYVRYLSFAGADELKAALMAKLPYKIDIGAVYNVQPSLHQSVSQFLPIEKELVFDVDMTDYDDVRRCCSEANICHRCWPLVTAAIKVVDRILRDDFGFRHILCVYSGRRGAHLWVCDARARLLSNELRTAVVDYISVHLGKDHGKDHRTKLQLTTPLHPSLARSYEQLLPFFEAQIELQRHLEDADSRQSFLDYFDDAVRPHFLFTDDDSDGRDRWDQLRSKVTAYIHRPHRSGMGARNKAVSSVIQRIVFGHVYPRLDVNVSKGMNHLLKAPFCVHPKTGRVCVPIEAERAEEFDPMAVPTVDELEVELNAVGVEGELGGVRGEGKGWERTSLKEYIDVFRRFVNNLQDDVRKQRSHAKASAGVGSAEDW